LESARRLSSEAVQLAPAAGWANEAILMDRTAEGDFAGARAALERAERLRIIDKTTGARQRAVLITAEAQSLADGPRWSEACDLAVEAARLAPDLVPASVLAGKLLAQRGDLKKAAKILEASWKASPHPDTAVVYVNLRTGDSTQDKLTRARNLARIQPRDPESALAIATSALEARDFAAARSALVDLAESQPTRRVCLLMARIEEAEGQAQGRVKSWLARASRARRDPAWVADGFVSDAWAPVSPATGRLDAFVWMAPPEQVRALAEAPDDVLADGHEAQVIDVAPEIEAELAPSAAPQPKPVTPAANPEPPAAANEASPPVGAEAAEKPAKPFVASVRPLPVVFPAPRAPDDPGSETAVAPVSTPEMSARLRNHG
jgi:HemY protein